MIEHKVQVLLESWQPMYMYKYTCPIQIGIMPLLFEAEIVCGVYRSDERQPLLHIVIMMHALVCMQLQPQCAAV